MCQFSLWFTFLVFTSHYAEGDDYTITAKESVVETRNFQTATLEWYFTFPDNKAVFMDIVTVTDSNIDINQIAYKNKNQPFQAYETMRDRLQITIPLNRLGVILDISNIVISDEGNYRCQARLSTGRTIKSIITLRVVVPPRINANQLTVHKTEGQDASLLCNLEAGNPKPLSFRWYKVIDNQRVPVTPFRDRDYNFTYYVPNVGRDSLGKYQCDVSGRGGSDSHTVTLFVKYKPVVTAPPLNRSVYEGVGVETFTCTCDGNAGEITYHWYKDCSRPQCNIKNDEQKLRQEGIRIINNGQGLQFSQPSRNLASWYFCAGSNSLGLGRAKGAYLHITYKPGPIEINPVDGTTVNGIEGRNMTVNCHSDANPPAHYNWIKFVKSFLGTVEELVLVRSGTSGDLKLYNVDRNDTGKYKCVAFNRPNGENPTRIQSSTKEVSINIRFGPRQTNFTINNKRDAYQEIKIYSKVVMRCVAHSEPGANFNIRREIVQIQLNSHIKQGIYTIERLEETHEAVYICFASNSITGKSELKRIKVVVAIPPTKVNPIPDSKKMSEGSTVTIKCYAKGKPPPRVYWQRYGANITHNDSVIQTSYLIRPLKIGTLSVVNAELRFNRIRYTDDASYSCIFYNSAGKVNISDIRYQVEYAPKLTPTGYPGNFTRIEGEKATFVCQAHAKPPNIQWKWLFNGEEIDEAVSNTFTRGFTKSVDNGMYQCIPRNAQGDGQIGTGYLEVQYDPTLTLKPKLNYTKDLKQSLTVRCDAEGVPTPLISWTKFSDSLFRHIGKELTFDLLEAKDRGEYTCEARNAIGYSQASTTIIIRHGPIITTNTPSDTKIGSEDGRLVSLRCDVDAYPDAEIKWKEYVTDTVIVSGAEYRIEETRKSIFSKSSTLKFTVHSSLLGKKYVCYTKNEIGTADQVYQVLVKGKPDPPEQNSLKAVDELVPTVPVTVNITFTWIPGYTGGSDVQYYLLYKERGQSQYREHFMLHERFTYVFKHRKTSTSYVFSMKAKNMFGVSQLYDPPLKFSTKNPPPAVANVTYERYGKDGTRVLITWYIFPVKNERRRRDVQQKKWSYGMIRYRIADIETKWTEEKILEIQTSGTYLVEDLQPEQLYVFHFILYDKDSNFGRPLLIGRFYPRYGPALPVRPNLTKTDIIAIGVGCGGATLVVAIIILIIAICKKRKPAYGIVSYGNGRARVDIPVSTTLRSGGYTGEVVRGSYLKPEEEEEEEYDEDRVAVDSGSGFEGGGKSPPPDYNDIHYSMPPPKHENVPDESFMSDELSPRYTTFGRPGKHYDSKDRGLNPAVSLGSLGSRATEITRGHNRHSFDVLADDYPAYRANKIGLGEPLLHKSISDLDDEYHKLQEQRYLRGELSPDLPPETPIVRIPPDESDMTGYRVPGAFGDRTQKLKKPSYAPYEDEIGSISPPTQIGSGRDSPNGSSVASSRPYRSDNEYIEDAEDNYVGFLV